MTTVGFDVPEHLIELYKTCYQPDAEGLDAAAYFAAAIDHAFNPRDGDEAQEFLLVNALLNAARWIEAQPCGCDPVDPWQDGPCGRCDALGRINNHPIER